MNTEQSDRQEERFYSSFPSIPFAITSSHFSPKVFNITPIISILKRRK